MLLKKRKVSLTPLQNTVKASWRTFHSAVIHIYAYYDESPPIGLEINSIAGALNICVFAEEDNDSEEGEENHLKSDKMNYDFCLQ